MLADGKENDIGEDEFFYPVCVHKAVNGSQMCQSSHSV